MSEEKKNLEVPTNCTRLPGFGLPVNYIPDEPLFKNVHPGNLGDRSADERVQILTLRELTMMRIMDEISDKVGWESKVFDEAILQTWRKELLLNKDQDVTPSMINWCFSELQYKAKLYQKTGILSIYKGDVAKSDTIVPHSLKNELKEAVLSLEDVPEKDKDWHPGSDGMVLDLVHPSLYPLIYGCTKILSEGQTTLEDCIESCGKGIVLPVPEGEETEVDTHYTFDWRDGPLKNLFSGKFQWLPCQVDISGKEDEVRITSYINNLHPQKYKMLYKIIEKLIGYAIPMWNVTLSPVQPGGLDNRVVRIDYWDVEYLPPSEEGAPQQEKDEEDWPYEERMEEWIRDNQILILPDAPEFSAEILEEMNPGFLVGDESVNLKESYSEQGLQVIVKLENVCLTPEKPEYKGGSWHVEGQLNEYICASAIYYYDCHNVTPSRLAFRHQSDVEEACTEITHEDGDHAWLESVFGCRQDESGIQFLGSVETREGRFITFPNILQHQVQPFKLQDSTKPGHRKIIALFLVDPNIQVISTANVPCQRRDWWAESVIAKAEGNLSKLPIELRSMVFEGVDGFPIGFEAAKQLREELVEERKKYRIAQTEAFGSLVFTL